MAIIDSLRGFAFAVVVLTVLASEEAVNERNDPTKNKILPIEEAAAKDEARNGTQATLDYSITVTMVNYGAATVKVQQRYLFPDGVEVKSFTLQKDGYRSKRSTDNQKLTQWVGGTVDLKPSDVKEADMTYINHPGEVINPNSKTFHKLSTAIMIKEGDQLGGKISSPNYPYSYPNGADLTWLIVYPEDNIVKLEVEDYATEECCDRVIVYDGLTKSQYPLATFEGDYSYSNNVVLSTRPAMFIRFTSDCLTTSRGFRASYINQRKSNAPSMQTTTTEPMSCGQVQSTSGNSGYFTSPNYPGTYDANMNCTWAVQTYYNTMVKFSLDYFYTGYDDQVSFYDGSPNNPGNHIRTYSGSYGYGYSIYASSNQAFAVFTSGYNSYPYNKFNISYDGEYQTLAGTTDSYTEQPNGTSTSYYDPPQCNNLVSTLYQSGYIYSPGYYSPGFYPTNDYCIWYISAPSYFNAVRFYPTYFSTERNYDWVRIYNYHSTSQSNLISEISGYVDPYTTIAVSNSRYATMTFDSDGSVDDRGFRIYFYGTDNYYYTTESPVEATTAHVNACPYPYNSGYSGYVQSPNYPYYYDNNMNCTQWVNTPYGTSVQLTVEGFSLNTGDYVYIYNGYNDIFLRYMSGTYSYGYSWQAPTNYIKLVFLSDSYYTSSGYSFRYEGVYDSYYTTASTEPAESCGGSTPFNYGVITSPNYPAYYDNYLDCIWTVTVNSDMYVLFTVDYFYTESCCDYVSFFSGTPDNSSTRIDTLQGPVNEGYEILIPDYQAWVTFHTDYSVTYTGFNITYMPVTTDFHTNSNATTNGYDVVTPGYDTTQWVRREVQAENAPKTFGKDLWGNKQKPIHLRKEKMKTEDQDEETLN